MTHHRFLPSTIYRGESDGVEQSTPHSETRRYRNFNASFVHPTSTREKLFLVRRGKNIYYLFVIATIFLEYWLDNELHLGQNYRDAFKITLNWIRLPWLEFLILTKSLFHFPLPSPSTPGTWTFMTRSSARSYTKTSRKALKTVYRSVF